MTAYDITLERKKKLITQHELYTIDVKMNMHLKPFLFPGHLPKDCFPFDTGDKAVLSLGSPIRNRLSVQFSLVYYLIP